MSSVVALTVAGSAAFAFVLVWWSMQSFTSGMQRYRAQFTESARVNLADAFIFIEPEKIYVANIIFLVGGFVLTWLLTGAWLLAVMAATGCAFFPRILFRLIRTRREKRFLAEMPDALNALAGMMKSGANLNVALEHLVSEASGPIAQEFGLFQRELRMGMDYGEALDNLCVRMPVSDLRLVASGIKISRDVGGELSEILARLGETIRRKLEMEGKIQALTAQGKYQGIVMAALPLLLAFAIFHIEPEAMARLFTEPMGWGVCAVMVVFEFLGYHFIKKIVTIDV